VTFVHRFGSALNANLHFDEIPSCISPFGSLPRSKSAPGRFVIARFIDGVFSAEAEAVHFHEATVLSREDLAAVQRNVRNRVLRLFARRGLITPEAAAEMRRWGHGGGFSLHAAVRVEATDRKGLRLFLKPTPNRKLDASAAFRL